MNTPIVNNVFLDVSGVQDAVVVTIHGFHGKGSYSFAIDVTEKEKQAGPRHFLPDVLKSALSRYYDIVARNAAPGVP